MSSGYTAPAEASEPWVGSEADSWEFVDAESGEGPAADAAQLPVPVRVRLTGEDYKREQIVPALALGVTTRYQLLACTDLPGLGQFVFPELADLHYDPELLSTPVLADLRIARAVRAGICAGQKLSGERAATLSSVKLTGCPNRWYVCLRGPNHPTGFVTSFYGVYHRNITVAGTSKFHPGGVSHSFPSLAEVTAFLAGARAQWPVELLNQ